MFRDNLWHKIVISSNNRINFNSKNWKNKYLIVNLANLQFSGTDVNNIGKIEIFNIKNKDHGIILRYNLLCYIYYSECHQNLEKIC